MADPKDGFKNFGPGHSSASPLLRMRQPDFSPMNREGPAEIFISNGRCNADSLAKLELVHR